MVAAEIGGHAAVPFVDGHLLQHHGRQRSLFHFLRFGFEFHALQREFGRERTLLGNLFILDGFVEIVAEVVVGYQQTFDHDAAAGNLIGKRAVDAARYFGTLFDEGFNRLLGNDGVDFFRQCGAN